MFEQGEIIIVPIPFTDLLSNKKRPALVISSNKYNNRTNDIIVMAITSNITNKEFSVNINNGELELGVLESESQIRVDKTYTISQSIVIKSIAKIRASLLGDIINTFDKIIQKK